MIDAEKIKRFFESLTQEQLEILYKAPDSRSGFNKKEY
jgi:hypothetical protein|uniref:Uncharacterized protein n=1 Tax=Myoviridae sp. ctk251 TaxID=2826689 RepID=A0A8S5MSS4_9CAUD|nr:MAG TPA: hypothetical protein [Myoviridae sp. ctk251]